MELISFQAHSSSAGDSSLKRRSEWSKFLKIYYNQSSTKDKCKLDTDRKDSIATRLRIQVGAISMKSVRGT